jgi:hypothetical protein
MGGLGLDEIRGDLADLRVRYEAMDDRGAALIADLQARILLHEDAILELQRALEKGKGHEDSGAGVTGGGSITGG